MKTLLTVTAIIEAGAGLALLGVPSVTALLLLGTPLDLAAAVSLARVGGAAILALAIVCWLARRDAQSPASRGLVVAMPFYNIAVAAVLAFASFGMGCTACCCGRRSYFTWRWASGASPVCQETTEPVAR